MIGARLGGSWRLSVAGAEQSPGTCHRGREEWYAEEKQLPDIQVPLAGEIEPGGKSALCRAAVLPAEQATTGHGALGGH